MLECLRSLADGFSRIYRDRGERERERQRERETQKERERERERGNCLGPLPRTVYCFGPWRVAFKGDTLTSKNV